MIGRLFFLTTVFKRGKAVKSGWPEGASCLAELGTVQLEFTRLSQITGDWKYHDAVRDILVETELN